MANVRAWRLTLDGNSYCWMLLNVDTCYLIILKTVVKLAEISYLRIDFP